VVTAVTGTGTGALMLATGLALTAFAAGAWLLRAPLALDAFIPTRPGRSRRTV